MAAPYRLAWLVLTLIPLALAVDASWSAASPSDWLPAPAAAREYAARALRTQRYVDSELTRLAGGQSCAEARYVGLRRGPDSALIDTWYVASQLQAEVALRHLGQIGRDCVERKTIAFFDFVSNPDPAGGYWPRADIVGRNLTTRDTYGDDNALIGIAVLEARDSSPEPAERAALLERAEHAARLLLDGPLWDDTFGGGFWWNTQRGERAEGKPAQTTALAVQLFLRLYEATGQADYSEAAERGLDWLDRQLYDPSAGLYRYTIRHWDLEKRQGEYVEPRSFGYDQGIMIEVHLLYDRLLARGQGHLERARLLANQLEARFWIDERGSYRLQTDGSGIYSGYAAWVSQSLLALYAADHDAEWLRRARANLDGLEAHALNPLDGSYVLMQYRCAGPTQPGCEHDASWTHDPTSLLFSQAWLQRSQALLARQLATIGQ